MRRLTAGTPNLCVEDLAKMKEEEVWESHKEPENLQVHKALYAVQNSKISPTKHAAISLAYVDALSSPS